ncbi:RING finger protein 10 [Euphorbia peplus]|nr:RING finger protein 10 [Euphorbia peplus]
MSILPLQAQGPTSSSPSDPISPNPNSNHGTSFSPQSQSQSQPQSPLPSSGLLAPAAEDSGGSSRKVNDLRIQNGRRSFSRQNGETNCHQGSGSAQSKGKLSETTPSPRGHQSNSPTNGQGGIAQSYGRRAQTMNANHLLNFHYDPIARSQPRAPPPRRQQKIKPYNRDLFLQANYKFVVLDTGNHASELVDPDKMLRWEDVICVKYSTPVPVQCPICLEHPLCPQITSCGHIFCFPCILQYLLMGKEDYKGDCFKRCPLCFVMISQRELYTIDIENVNQYSVGDAIDFMLLTRQKDSFTPSQKNSEDDMHDPFSKFTFTSDLELSVRKAISDLDGWLAKADSGLVDDLEKLPYVCAAMEQLKQRKKYWNTQGMCADGRIYKDSTSQKQVQERMSTADVICAYHDGSSCRCLTQSLDSKDEKKGLDHVKLNLVEPLEGEEPNLPSPYDEGKSSQKIANGSTDVKGNDSYNFYQAVDGQHLILHPLNMKCLLHHYGSYDMLPHRISGKILQLESVTQTEAIRRRYRYLSHFSLTTTFQLCEIDLNEVLPPDSLYPFHDEIKKREKQRKQLAEKERKDKIKAEVADAAYSLPVLSSWGHSSHGNSPNFSMDDFEALGGNTAMSSSPPTSSSPPLVGERILFSNVARLGFAAAPDSPALKVEENSASNSSKVTNSPSGASGPPTFANVTSRVKLVENLEAPKINETGKKGKKASRVLMSTAGGRRY